MKVVRFDEESAPGLYKDGISEIWLEFDERGYISREIGFGHDGSVVHKHPGRGPFGRYGVFDMNIIEPSSPCDVSVDEFERVWEDAGTL